MEETSSYNQVPYLFTSFPETHPRRLHAAAHLLGLQAPPPQKCRVLELGCAVGGNIVPMAYSLPDAQFIGIDLAESQVETARRFSDGVGLKNLDLRAANITDVTREWGTFDYIITHGVFSWVPQDVAEKVLQICGEQLTPRGVAYISFNTFPGWHARMWVREAMLFHTEGIEDPIQRAKAAREFVIALGQSPFLSGEKSALLQGELKYIQDKPDAYLLHEHLETTNHPFYFRDFAARAGRHGLQYLGDSLHNGVVAEEAWAPFKPWLQAHREDLIRIEQYADFARNRMFRRALLCRADNPIQRDGMLQRAETMSAVSFLRQWPEANGMSRFEHPRGPQLVTGPGPLRDALETISKNFPHDSGFGQLLNAAGAGRDQLAQELINCWLNGTLELTLDPPALISQAGERPQASPVARYLCANNQAPINRRHESIPMNPNLRTLITHLDGTRTRDQIAAELSLSRENLEKILQTLASFTLLEA